MSVFRSEQNQVHSMQGYHIAGVATPSSGAQQVEVWHGRMDAHSATPPQPAQCVHRASLLMDPGSVRGGIGHG